MSSPISYKETLDPELSIESLTLTDKTKDEGDECPVSADSCDKIYSGFCVPSMGKIVLAQQWLVNKKTNKFTVRGLWPNSCDYNTSPEEGCDTSRNYEDLDMRISNNPKLHVRLLDDMPSDQISDVDHWKHRWEKHGTCLSTIENTCVGKNLNGNHGKNPGDDAIRYFRKTLDLYDEYNIMRKFEKANITPSKSPYPKEIIMEALSEWKEYISLYCVKNKLKEIHLYFYGAARNTFQPRGVNNKGNCTDDIYLPVQGIEAHSRRKREKSSFFKGGINL